MSYEETSEDLNKSVDELANLMNDTFTCCIRNYEALLPYFEKKETKPKIYYKLVEINILLNKLNEVLVGLRVQYVTLSLNEQKRECVVSEGGRKRRMSDVSEEAGQEARRIKTEVSFPSRAECCNASTSDARSCMPSENLLSVDNEETRYTQVQESDGEECITIEIQDSDEVEDLLVKPVGNGEISAASCDSNAGVKESASVADRLMGVIAYDKSADTVIQSENNKECIPLQKVERKSCIKEKSKNDGHILSKDHDINRAIGREICCTTFSCQRKRSFNSRYVSFSQLYGIVTQKHGRYRCMLCYREFVNYDAVEGHVKGKQHKLKRKAAKKSRGRESEVPNNSCITIASISVFTDLSYTLTDNIPRNNCESIASVSACSDVSCSLDNSLAIVEDSHKVISMKKAISLDDMWNYFDAEFHINKKFLFIYSEQVICYLCNEQIGSKVVHIKKHISSVHHLHRINIITKIEMHNKSLNNNLPDTPGILKFIPMTDFSLEATGFFCNVCDSFYETEVVLSHITGYRHWKNVKENELEMQL